MTVSLKAMHLYGEKFDIYIDSQIKRQHRLRCRLGLSGVRENDKPAEFIDYLKQQHIAARLEAKTNVCGECENFCHWNDCCSIPCAALEKILPDIWQAAEHLYGRCRWAEVTVDANGTEYSFSWQPGKMQYFDFSGVNASLIDSLTALSECEEVIPLTYESKTVGVQIKVAQKAVLSVVFERMCATIGRNQAHR